MAGLYLHVPFCQQKCHYCDFFSAPPLGDQLTSWHQLLERNLHLIAQEYRPLLETVFFGGGTPSLLTPSQIATILSSCQKLFPVSSGAEISLEANPGTLTVTNLKGYLSAGINRLSIGVQSFDDETLDLLGRRHNAAEARQIFIQARSLGFTNISLDLIFALPGQSLAALDRELEQLLELSPEHVGIYGLSIEPGTHLAKLINKGQLRETTDEAYAEAYLHLHRRLTAEGYDHYEISNFARPGYRCRHNQGYWQRKPCLAAGAGAHGFNPTGYGQRNAIPNDLLRYQQKLDAGENPAELLEEFDQQLAMVETLYLGLRTSDGVDRTDFAQKFGSFPEVAFPAAFHSLGSKLHLEKNRYFFNPEEWLLYDHLISHFL